MAVSGSTRKHHVDLDHCLRFLESKNSAKQMLNNAVSRYEKFVISGLDSFLLLFQKSLRKHDVEKVLNYLRNFEIMDEADCERISCQSISDLMVTELVTMIRTKDPHAFWYFAHSLKKNALFQFFHGGIHCCVCEEVQAKEKEIDETIFEGNETTPAMVPLLKKQIIDALERKPWKNVWVKKKKDVRRTALTVKKRFDDFRQVVGPSIREVKTAFKDFLEMSKDKKDEQSQQQPEIKIPIQEEEPAKLEEGVEDGTEPVYQDEEAGDMRKPSKAKPKITAFVPTFDYIEGRKKYIAFVIVSIFTLYSYVDSVIKIIPF